jgi:ribosomal protein L7/L12
MTAAYQKTILLLQEELDWKSICFQVASNYPDVFCEAYHAVNKLEDIELDRRLIDCLAGTRGNKIKTLKMHRELTGSTLKEAMDYVNQLIESLNL